MVIYFHGAQWRPECSSFILNMRVKVNSHEKSWRQVWIHSCLRVGVGSHCPWLATRVAHSVRRLRATARETSRSPCRLQELIILTLLTPYFCSSWAGHCPGLPACVEHSLSRFRDTAREPSRSICRLLELDKISPCRPNFENHVW
jgi:hypothetical protein